MLYIIKPTLGKNDSVSPLYDWSFDIAVSQICNLIDNANENYDNFNAAQKYIVIEDDTNLKKFIAGGKLKNTKAIFWIDLDDAGINEKYIQMLKTIRKNRRCFSGSKGIIFVNGQGDLYTKNVGRELAFDVNRAGMSLIGKSLVECVGDLKNFTAMSKIGETTKKSALKISIEGAVSRLFSGERHMGNRETDGVHAERKKIFAVHSSHFERSNTMLLWAMVKEKLKKDFPSQIEIVEKSLENGKLQDCRGCSHNTCMHFAKEKSCYYGGYIVDEVYPEILSCDALVVICPNYNDAAGANITALINRLTALYKTASFEKKNVYAVIVSGYSGGDIVAKQIIGALNMNKGFHLPGNFAILETANEAGEVLCCRDIEKKASAFAENIVKTLTKG